MKLLYFCLLVLFHDILCKIFTDVACTEYTLEHCFPTIGFVNDEGLSFFKRLMISYVWDIVGILYKIKQLSFILLAILIYRLQHQKSYILFARNLFLVLAAWSLFVMAISSLLLKNMAPGPNKHLILTPADSANMVGLIIATIVCYFILLIARKLEGPTSSAS